MDKKKHHKSNILPSMKQEYMISREFEVYYSWSIPSIGVVQRSMEGVCSIQ